MSKDSGVIRVEVTRNFDRSEDQSVNEAIKEEAKNIIGDIRTGGLDTEDLKIEGWIE